MKKGYVSLILHSHMPFVRHPEQEDSLEERWLFEAMSECYIPLINVYDNLIKDNIKFKITMSITPPLMSMLEDEYLNERYLNYLEQSIDLSENEIIRTKDNEELNNLAHFYNDRFKKILDIYNKYDRRLMNAFRKFDRLGVLEILTCSATHALLPLLTINPETIEAQIATAVQSYTECVGHKPRGIWLPECAYTYDLDEILKKYGIKYFISESKAILNASPKPKYGTYTPISTHNGICVFGRDMESSRQVWSSFMGYPGDFNYREFYRDIGYEAPMEYIAPYINRGGIRIDTGIKYYKITGKTDNKQYYNREMAMKKVRDHAGHFADGRNAQLEYAKEHMDVSPLIVCPYDTELYGHWWFEGPDFINEFIRMSAEDWTKYELTTPYHYIKENPIVQCSSPCPSTWGENSNYSVWLNPSNHWIYRKLHRSEQAMIRLANTYKEPDEITKRALNQAARELMLAESSDWPFIIKNNTTVEYAVRRVNSHISRFNKIYEDISRNSIDTKWLSNIESLDNIFPNIDYRIYSS
ncbi:glycoside hydrolase [Clostridium novyi A str. BKT29909]|uniref:glycoside hydrolase family 57 protein n=1 Tax=Clostridium TaxID=1485 RepID=UPI0004D6E402|nr:MULTISPECIES: 1,4-alpha-glucan branching protein domain-containing protein [Clostridium]KEH87966.1 glycoside hydrolase [Clostridium novyi A str. BKT29909]KEH92441.1 glycoside hydrolase [Clostridium botulinum C/D str. It1]